MFKHILVPLDGSHLAEAALPATMELAAKFNSEITLLRITQPPYIPSHTSGQIYADLMINMRQEAQKIAEAYLKGQKGSLRQQGFIVNTLVVQGESPAMAILDVAEGQNIDTIVMSTHGRGGIARWVYGSVADKVLRHADMPILLVRAKEILEII